VVYSFSAATQNWDKSGVEGTLFVCEQEPQLALPAPRPRACVFVLNRRGLNNLIVDLTRASACEVSGELIMFNVPDEAHTGLASGAGEDEDAAAAAAGEGTGVIGVWIHADEDDTRDVNAAIIQETWRQVRPDDDAEHEDEHESHHSSPAHAEQPSGAQPGRRLSISDLFGQKMGGFR
jgi:hypothetical protein